MARSHPGLLSRILLPPGLAAQLRAGYRLVHSTPGLPIYLAGGCLVWLGCRVLIAHGLARGPWGTAVVDTVRLCGLATVVLLYFRRTGQLVEGRAHLRRLRAVLAGTRPWQEEVHWYRRLLWRGLAWILRTQQVDLAEKGAQL
jgi:hypothetical protein